MTEIELESWTGKVVRIRRDVILVKTGKRRRLGLISDLPGMDRSRLRIGATLSCRRYREVSVAGGVATVATLQIVGDRGDG